MLNKIEQEIFNRINQLFPKLPIGFCGDNDDWNGTLYQPAYLNQKLAYGALAMPYVRVWDKNFHEQIIFLTENHYSPGELVEALIAARLTCKDNCVVLWRGYDLVERKLVLAIGAMDGQITGCASYSGIPSWLERAWEYKLFDIDEVLQDKNYIEPSPLYKTLISINRVK